MKLSLIVSPQTKILSVFLLYSMSLVAPLSPQYKPTVVIRVCATFFYPAVSNNLSAPVGQQERLVKSRDMPEMPEICLCHPSSVVARKLVEGHITSNRHHELYLWFTTVCLRGLNNSHITITIETRTHINRNFFDHKDLENYLIQFCP